MIDLGSGAGFDIFIAAKRVGLRGRAIGIDMNEVRVLARSATSANQRSRI